MEKRLSGAALAVILLGLAGLSVLAVQYPITVTAIAVEGNVEIRTKEVLDAVVFEVGASISESDLRAASQAIYDLGWFSEVMPVVGSDGTVLFRVVENPTIREIAISGNTNVKVYRLFGVRLFDAPIMSTTRVKRILREHEVKRGKVLNLQSLQEGIDAVLEAYRDDGYVLVMVGDVSLRETLSIEFVEARLEGNVILGLNTVPASEAERWIDIPLGEPVVQKDLQAVFNRLRTSVYFTDMDVNPVEGVAADSVVLQWTLTERVLLDSPISVNSIALLGVTQFPADVAVETLGALPEMPIGNFELLKVIEGLHELYYRSGFVMTRFTVNRVDAGVLYLRVEEGVVASVSIDSSTTTQQRVLEKNIEIHVGRILTLNDLRVSQQKLNGLGYFSTVNIDPQWGEEGVDVAVSVADRKDLGGMNGAIAFEPTTGGLVGELSISQRNLFGTGQDLSLAYKRGISPEGDPETSTWSLGYSSVALASRLDRVGFDVYRKTRDVEIDDSANTYITIGGAVSFAYPLADYTDLTLGYRHEIERLKDETVWSPIDSVTLSLGHDTTDDLYFPMRGTRRTASVEQAGGFVPGDMYTKLDLTWIQFTPVYGGWFGAMDETFGIRFKVGWGSEGLPATQTYELGGPASVRGREGAAVDRMFLANFEHRLQLIEGLVVTTFLDWGVNLNSIRPEDVLSSTGIEVGITAAGVYIRIDVAWALGQESSWMPRLDIGFGPLF